MIDRSHIEKLLSLNGVSLSSSDDDIKSVLLKASWQKDDVDSAIAVLRRSPNSTPTMVDTTRTVFHTDDKLDPNMVSSLLGITMDVTGNDVELRRISRKGLNVFDIAQLLAVSFVISALVIFFAMWHFEVGVFHFTSR